MPKNRSFTLIELLVVIAIIGLLSSIVLVSTQGLKDKAKIAKGLEFSQSVQHTLGANAVGWWSFETIEAGNQVIDGSGYNNHGTVNGAALVPGLEQLGNALSFDGINNYAQTGAMASDLNAGSYAVEMWIYPWDCAYKAWAGITLGSWYQQGFAITLTRFLTYTDTVIQRGYSLNWQEWQHLVVTHDLSTKTFKFYRNGVSLASNLTYTGNLSASNKIITIAGRGTSSPTQAVKAIIDELRIYNEALSMAEIQKHYAEGIERHQNLAITK